MFPSKATPIEMIVFPISRPEYMNHEAANHLGKRDVDLIIPALLALLRLPVTRQEQREFTL